MDCSVVRLSGGGAMIETAKTRSLISLESYGITIRGTYHRPYEQSCGPSSMDEPNRVGILFLNSLSLPRSATGDSAVYWADSFAASGYPSVRIDLPGLGDSDGDIPEDLLGFINSGGYAKIISSIVKQLVCSFDLSGVIIIGHCAGSISALYAAANSDCKGLVLMDPYFYLPPLVKQSSVWKRLSGASSYSGLSVSLTSLYGMVKDTWMSLRENVPPGNANLALLQRWKEAATKGLPILLLKSPGQITLRRRRRVREFDYTKYILKLAGRQSKVSILTVEGTDHSFANRAGRDAVREHTEHWLSVHFPLMARGVPVPSTMLPAASETRTNQEIYTSVCEF
jgi:pimeloyl-ACP methyl ester carboxylesterase